MSPSKKENKPWKFAGKPYKVPGRAGTHKAGKGTGSYTRKDKHKKSFW